MSQQRELVRKKPAPDAIRWGYFLMVVYFMLGWGAIFALRNEHVLGKDGMVPFLFLSALVLAGLSAFYIHCVYRFAGGSYSHLLAQTLGTALLLLLPAEVGTHVPGRAWSGLNSLLYAIGFGGAMVFNFVVGHIVFATSRRVAKTPDEAGKGS